MQDTEEVFTVQCLAGLLHVTGSGVRALYVAISHAVQSEDPEALEIAARRLEACPGWIRASDAFNNPRHKSSAALQKAYKAMMEDVAEDFEGAKELADNEGESEEQSSGGSVHAASWLEAITTWQTYRGQRSTSGSGHHLHQHHDIVERAQSIRGSSLNPVGRMWNLPVWAIFGFQASGFQSI